jgi:hypothetical protein
MGTNTFIWLMLISCLLAPVLFLVFLRKELDPARKAFNNGDFRTGQHLSHEAIFVSLLKATGLSLMFFFGAFVVLERLSS